MVTINTTEDSRYFTLNGVKFAAIYQPLAAGDNSVSIYSIFDTNLQLLAPTNISEVQVNGVTYTDRDELIDAILSIIISIISDSDFSELSSAVEALSQGFGAAANYNYDTYNDMVTAGLTDANFKFTVIDDPNTTIQTSFGTNNGQYVYFNGAYEMVQPVIKKADSFNTSNTADYLTAQVAKDGLIALSFNAADNDKAVTGSQVEGRINEESEYLSKSIVYTYTSSDFSATPFWWDIDGAIATSSTQDTSGFRGLRIPVTEGQKFNIFTEGGVVSARAWGTSDASGNMIRVAAPSLNTLTNGVEITIESGESFLYINCSNALTTNADTFKVTIGQIYQYVDEKETAIYAQIADNKTEADNGIAQLNTDLTNTNTKVSAIDATTISVPGKNLINPNDFLYGYSLVSGSFQPKASGIFSNKINLEINQDYTSTGVRGFPGIQGVFVALFTEGDVFVRRYRYDYLAGSDTTNQIVTFSLTDTDFDYVRILIQDEAAALGIGGLTNNQLEEGSSSTAFEPYTETKLINHTKLDNYEPPAPVVFDGKMMMAGASFAYDGNGWFELACAALNFEPDNRAIPGDAITNFAQDIFNNVITDADLLDIDVLAIMHVHNQDVYDTGVHKALGDYVLGDLSNYSAAYDYVLKYVANLYYNQNVADTDYYDGVTEGKAFNVIICTHWHDSRTIFNDSVRLLTAAWGLPLVEFDKKIGFSKDTLHPTTGEQWSVLFGYQPNGPVETIGGTVYGWHPVRGQERWIQKKMAAIFTDKFVEVGFKTA